MTRAVRAGSMWREEPRGGGGDSAVGPVLDGAGVRSPSTPALRRAWVEPRGRVSAGGFGRGAFVAVRAGRARVQPPPQGRSPARWTSRCLSQAFRVGAFDAPPLCAPPPPGDGASDRGLAVQSPALPCVPLLGASGCGWFKPPQARLTRTRRPSGAAGFTGPGQARTSLPASRPAAARQMGAGASGLEGPGEPRWSRARLPPPRRGARGKEAGPWHWVACHALLFLRAGLIPGAE